jgi:hypothetical protein
MQRVSLGTSFMRTRMPHPRPLLRSRREISLPLRQPIREDDPAVLRVRDAGGPLDQASYACECGLVFVAPVSTSVDCPHCQAAQPW